MRSRRRMPALRFLVEYVSVLCQCTMPLTRHSSVLISSLVGTSTEVASVSLNWRNATTRFESSRTLTVSCVNFQVARNDTNDMESEGTMTPNAAGGNLKVLQPAHRWIMNSFTTKLFPKLLTRLRGWSRRDTWWIMWNPPIRIRKLGRFGRQLFVQ